MKHFIPFNLAKNICLKTVKPLKKIAMKIQDAVFYVLAQDCKAKINLPEYNCSTKDGFALKSSKTKNCSISKPLYLKIVETIYAGEKLNKKNFYQQNSCVKIMTGAFVPKYFDAVVPKEFVFEENGYIKITYPIKKWSNIRKRTEQLKKNELLFTKGTFIRPQELGVLISAGFKKVFVYQKPIVGIIATGNELVDIDKKPSLGKIRDINSYILQTLLQKYHLHYITYGIVQDNFQKLKTTISTAIKKCDVILISGGISHGECDLIKPVLKSLKVEPIFWEIKCRPAKPLFFGIKNFNHKKKFIFGIPGNPVSNFVIFEVLIKDFLMKFTGNNNVNEKIFNAILTQNIKKEFEYKYFLRGNYVYKNNKFYVTPIKNQDSGILKNVARANCLIILDEQCVDIKSGNIVKIQLLD